MFPRCCSFVRFFRRSAGSEQIALIISAVSTLAGNLTIVGSIANLIVIEQARRHGVGITFSEYLQGGDSGHDPDDALASPLSKLAL